jgi:hypothetical protein
MQWVVLQLYIQHVQGSNLSQETDCLGKGLPWCSEVTPAKYIIHNHGRFLPCPFYSLIQSFDAIPSKPLTASLNNYLHASKYPLAPSLLTNLCQMNQVHTTPPYFTKIHFNIIVLRMLRSSTRFLSFSFPTKTPPTPLLAPMRATCPAHLILRI